MTNLQIKRIKGPELNQYISDLGKLRIQIFKDYPYLYQGDLDYEKKYLKTYTQSPESVLVLALDGSQVVGASSALPLKNEMAEIKAPFLSAGIDINTIFYFGESVLLPAYRAQKIYPCFFSEREAAAREQGYNTFAFCAVERAPNHPKKPKDWRPLDSYWQKLGYVKHPELKAFISWREIGEAVQTPKPMIFWLKTTGAL